MVLTVLLALVFGVRRATDAANSAYDPKRR